MKRVDMIPGVLYAIRCQSWEHVRPGWVVDTAMGWKRGPKEPTNGGLAIPRRTHGGNLVVVEVLDTVHVHDRDETGHVTRERWNQPHEREQLG